MRNKNHTGIEFADSLIQYLESLNAKREFAGVIDYYENNRNVIANTGDKSAGLILKQIAIAFASSSEFNFALKAIRLAQNHIARLGDSLDLAEICLVLAGILRDIGEMNEAERAFRDAESIFRRNDCALGQSKALNQLAGLFFRQNDYKSALPPLLEALEIARNLKDRNKIAYMMGNIGRIHSFLGNVSEARHHLELNLQLSIELADKNEQLKSMLFLGYLDMMSGNYEKAEKHFDKTYVQLENHNNKQLQIICLTYLGELYRRIGKFDDSEIALNLALKMVKHSKVESSLKARVMRQLAELYVKRNNFRKAYRYVSKALIINEKCNISAEIGAAWKIKGIIADSSGKSDEAREFFGKSLEILENSQVRFELTEVLIAAASSRQMSDKKRLAYLFRAEEFYSSNGLHLKLNHVEKLIEQISPSMNCARESQSVNHEAIKNSATYLTKCKEINQFLSQLALIAKADIPLLFTGETGVGKDHMARYYHAIAFLGKPFKTVSCASIPETLLESELFGYKKGAFTDAVSDKEGLMVAANSGILFLDEIGDVPLSLQAKLLGVLEHRKVTPLGSTREVDLDIKLVTATNRNLEEMVERGTFRRDLYYRISGITFHIPSLRERKEDIPLLMGHYLKNVGLFEPGSKIPVELIHQFLKYSWPGNVRELSNKIKRLGIMAQMVAEGDLVELSMALFDFEKQERKTTLFNSVREFERKLLVDALLAASGNKSEAARILGIHEATVRTKLKRYGISQLQ